MKNPRLLPKKIYRNPQKNHKRKINVLYYFVVIKLQTIANMKFCIRISEEVNYVAISAN